MYHKVTECEHLQQHVCVGVVIDVEDVVISVVIDVKGEVIRVVWKVWL